MEDEIAYSCLPQSVPNSAMVISEVQQRAFAEVVPLAGVKGVVHFAASSGLSRMFVVVCKSHKEWRQTSPRSDVKETSHSKIPAPIRAPAIVD